jgi:hypothetical protein
MFSIEIELVIDKYYGSAYVLSRYFSGLFRGNKTGYGSVALGQELPVVFNLWQQVSDR